MDAERFVLANARLLDRHRLAVLLHGEPPGPVIEALRAYRNVDGGFGHALEPDVRAPESEPASTLHALEVLAEIGALDDPMVAEAAAWIATVADTDGGLPFVLPTAAAHPHAPWMTPSAGGSHLTFAVAVRLWEARSDAPWLSKATDWGWRRLANADELGGYCVKYAFDLLDAVPDDARAIAAHRDAAGATLGRRLAAGRGRNRRRASHTLDVVAAAGPAQPRVFTEQRIAADLHAAERGQQDDGGWTFDWLAWSPGQSVEWRGGVTVRALATLAAHDRIPRA